MSEKPIVILLIEDNPGDARLIREVLAEEPSAQFTVAHSSRLEDGLERLAKGGIDVVLLDLSLPDSHGLETFHQVHALSPETPIVVLSALDDEAVAVETLRGGGQDYCIKTYLNYAIIHRSITHAIERGKVNVARNRTIKAAKDELSAHRAPLLARVTEMLSDPATDADLLATLTAIRDHLELEARLIEGLSMPLPVRPAIE